MQRTYKFRLCPTKEQEVKFLWTLDKCRFVYNKLLEGLSKQDKINKNELQHSILRLKEENPELKNVYSKVLQYENYRLFSNLHALSKLKKNGRKVGRLRFKGADWFKTFIYNQSGFKIINNNMHYDKLCLAKIGEIPFIMHRQINGKIKQIIIKYYSSGEWYALIIVDISAKIPQTKNMNKVGIDLGTLNYIYDSDGNHFDNPRYLDKSLKKLRKAQQRLFQKKNKSKNRFKQKIKVAKIYQKIVNQRNDFLHKLSRYYINNYDFIAIEKLNICNLIRISYNAKNIMSAAWSQFIQMLQYKAESAGVEVVKVNPKGTTQICSSCRTEIHKELWNRKHVCKCGLDIDRDYNSAINILNRALGQELSESTPVKIDIYPEML